MLKWFPWKWLVKRAARRAGMIDPFMVMARLKKFAEPSEVEAPIELMRAWSVFQARGVVNTRAIQHNLDWVWPYWVEKQFNPRDHSFVPRSFSMAHINLTHRDWVAVSLPHADNYSLVDPRGLTTPLHDGWSIDAWIAGGKQTLVPSQTKDVRQILKTKEQLAVETTSRNQNQRLTVTAEMTEGDGGDPLLNLKMQARGVSGDMLCVALRPYNPEGIQFIDSVKLLESDPGWRVNGTTVVSFSETPERYLASDYATGDVFNRLDDPEAPASIHCPVGMATAAALFPIADNSTTEVAVHVPVAEKRPATADRTVRRPRTTWRDLDALSPRLEVPDKQMNYVYRAAVSTLLSLSAGEVVPGSYTYRRFWVRDAALMLHALLTLNHEECCRRAFATSFPQRQTSSGFFQSQEGEWDANGQVLWLAGRYVDLTGHRLDKRMLKSIRKGARWLLKKRLPDRLDQPHPGLLPSGFSAEHLGPNNHYYWDNFWGLAGLHEAVRIFTLEGDTTFADLLNQAAADYENCITTSIQGIHAGRSRGGIPAAPGRRMDAGAIGSIVTDYPLHQVSPGDSRIMKTVDFLLDNCMVDNGFFHDMTHSGINPYLTLHIAQVLLRADDDRFYPLVRRVLDLASPAGQWPEAIHPFSGGGCMGDGQHGWAAAEWVLMVRALFLREENNNLIAAPGLPVEWLAGKQPVSFGPTSTGFGPVQVRVSYASEKPEVVVSGEWRDEVPTVKLGKRLREHATLKIEDLKS